MNPTLEALQILANAYWHIHDSGFDIWMKTGNRGRWDGATLLRSRFDALRASITLLKMKAEPKPGMCERESCVNWHEGEPQAE